MNNTFGITDKSYTQLIEQLRQQAEIEEVKIFGSWAMGNYKDGSDIDLCIYGENVTQQHLFKLKYNIEENTYIPYLIDLVLFDSIKSDELIIHLKQYGKTIYSRGDIT